MLRRALIALLATLSLVLIAQGCAVDAHEDGDVEVVAQSITDGTLHFGHLSVGQLRASGGGSCTATLVGRRTVLTAAHCVREGNAHEFTLAGRTYASASATRHPQYNGSNLDFDIGVVILKDAPPITPSAVNLVKPLVGQKLTLVGYGVTGSNKNDSGTKRIATNAIHHVFSTRISFLGSGNGVGNTCNGDSGGPAFSIVDGEEVVVGVTSSGTVPCGNDGFDTRVDVFVKWLEQVSGGDLAKSSGGAGRLPGSTDKIAPSVGFTSHKDGQRLQPGPVTITGNASDNVAIATVTLVINGRVFGTRAAAPFSWSLQFVPGNKDLELVAADTSGNLSKVAIVVTVEGKLSQFGDSCSSSVQCESRLCVYSRSLGRRYCSDVCSPSNNLCPPNGTCVQTTQQGFYVCALNEASEPVPGGGTVIRPETAPDNPQPRPVEPTPEQPQTAKPRGGCSVSAAAGADASALWLALLGLALWSRRRRLRGEARRRR